MVPVKVPALSPVTLEDTVTVAGVVPVVGETESQDAPLAAAVNVVLGVALSVKICEAGEAPPDVAENDSEAGLTVNVDAEFTVKVTGTVVVSPLPVIVIVPFSVPAANPATLDVTVTVAGVVPVAGETVSHGAPLTLAVKVVLGAALTERLCAAGELPPAVAENDSKPGVTFNVGAGFTVKLTGTERVSPLPVIVIVPLKLPAANPETLDDTVNVAGVVPVAGETVNHGAPLTTAVKIVLGAALIDKLCAAGELPPAVAENDSEAGLTVSVLAAAEIVRVTGTWLRLSSPNRTVIVPL
jgi:hypothetical protein